MLLYPSDKYLNIYFLCKIITYKVNFCWKLGLFEPSTACVFCLPTCPGISDTCCQNHKLIFKHDKIAIKLLIDMVLILLGLLTH